MNDDLIERFEIALGDNLEAAKAAIAFMCGDLCAVCVLRFLNYQGISLYAQPIEAIEGVLEHVQPDASFAGTCIVCHNIMRRCAEEQFKQQVFDFIQDSGFEFNQYLLNITVPPFYELNDALYKHKLEQHEIRPLFATEEKYPKKAPKNESSFKMIMNAVLPIKKAAKFILGPWLTTKLEVPVHYLSYFRCEILVRSSMQIRWTEEQLKQLPKALRRSRSQNKEQVGENGDYGLDGEVQRIIDADGWNSELLAEMCVNDFETAEIGFSMQIDRDPVYVAGRYLKLQRGIAQTGDMQDAGQSVDFEEEEACKLPYAMNTILEPLFRKYVNFDKFVFHAAGREDIDVRMLGNGRPFICELEMAKNACRQNWAQIGSEIDAELEKDGFLRIFEQQLKIYEKHDDALMRMLYQGGQEKVKHYRAICMSAKPVGDLDLSNMEVLQKTPIRVLHRRALLTRQKEIHSVRLVESYGCFFVCDISASAGCYIKEFVHGDFGRTKPNLREILGCECEILQLDVMGVEMQWPPEGVDDWVERVAPK